MLRRSFFKPLFSFFVSVAMLPAAVAEQSVISRVRLEEYPLGVYLSVGPALHEAAGAEGITLMAV